MQTTSSPGPRRCCSSIPPRTSRSPHFSSGIDRNRRAQKKASGEQTEGIAQVNQAVAHLDDSIQQNAALVEQAAATAKGLAERAEVLDEAVRLFTVAQA
ncbi:putative methyl-accepting chemotaxis sensory transducer [Caballeronia catudaia]|uniref:Methyl-accepting chemotaxis sensory transducer n=1 Tax=Caballeronia catudaia TaxID=1777136 RepID=A0A158BSH9_9BURK|nr:putative methyl-accepting chemotaxis sensory transducer [Caballeronia catudaia]